MINVSLANYKKGVRQLHDMLTHYPDGLTAVEISSLTHIPRGAVNALLEDNLLFYVDRWQPAKSNGVLCRVWAASDVTNLGNCPHPDDV